MEILKLVQSESMLREDSLLYYNEVEQNLWMTK